MIGTCIVGKLSHFYPVEGMLTAGLCMANGGGVGELDNKFIGDSPYDDNRVARMKSPQKNIKEHGVHAELTILPGFAHETGEKERVQAAQNLFIQYL